MTRVTGPNFTISVTKKNKNIIEHNKELSILASQYGLSFMIEDKSNQEKKFFEYLFKDIATDEISNKLLEIIKERPVLTDNYQKVKIIHHNRLNNIVPTKYFQNNKADLLLKQNVKVSEQDFIVPELIEDIDAVNIYVPFKNLGAFFHSNAKEVNNSHSASVFFSQHKKIRNDYKKLFINEVFINLFPNDFQIAVYQNEKFILYNHFEFDNEDEFLYYLFFIMETLELDKKDTRFFITGVDWFDKNIKNLKQFTENISLAKEKKLSRINNYI